MKVFRSIASDFGTAVSAFSLPSNSSEMNPL